MNASVPLKHKLNEAEVSPRHAVADEASVLTDIYRGEINLAVWRRQLSPAVNAAVSSFLGIRPYRRVSVTLSPANAEQVLSECFDPLENIQALAGDMALLVDMFCSLFDLKRAGLRLAVVDQAMCPRFHVDWVPCRLITTYHGAGTEWLPHEDVDRRKLGHGNNGLPDEESGLFHDTNAIQHLSKGDVSLMKGERWEGNQGAGLVHRSPNISRASPRLLMTLDFMDG